MLPGLTFSMAIIFTSAGIAVTPENKYRGQKSGSSFSQTGVARIRAM